MLLLCGFAVDFNFFTANPLMFAVRNRFANQNLKSAICGFANLRTDLRKYPAQSHTKSNDNA